MIWLSARVCSNIDQPQCLWTDHRTDDGKYRNIGNLDLLGKQTRTGADRQNDPGRKQRLFRDFN